MVIGLPPPGGMGGSYHHHPLHPHHAPPSSSGSYDREANPDYDGKRPRKTMMRKTVDYNSSFLNMIQNRVWQRDLRDRRALQPDICYYPQIIPPQDLLDNPVNAVTTRFVKTATNKMRCPIFCLSWTPEGRRLITGASSGEFTLWNGLTFNFETILQAHDSPVRAMQWSHNDSWMITGDHGGYIKYWQSNMNNVKMFQAHKEPIRKVAFSPTDAKFASCSDDGTVRIWDFQRCEEERVLRGHGADVKCVDWHPQKGIIVSGSKDSQQPIKLWDPKTGQVLSTIHAHKSTVMDCQWNKNGNWLLTASRDHLLKLFDIRNLKEEVQTFRGHKKEASAVAWHPVHEGAFASGGSDGSIIFWSVGAEKEIGVIEQAHESIVWCLVWHPVGHILTTGSNDHTVKFWSRNRPGDSMRDKYNLNTLPPGQEEDYGNLADVLGAGGSAAGVGGAIGEDGVGSRVSRPSLPIIPGMAPEDRVENAGEIAALRPSIPGLDFQPVPEEPKKQPYAKPISKSFMANWNEPERLEPERGVKRPFGDREGGGGFAGLVDSRKENLAPNSIPLFQLQQEATAVVARGQIIPVVPGGSLHQAILSGEGAIRDVLHREFNISHLPPMHQQQPPMFPGSGGGMVPGSFGGPGGPPPPQPPGAHSNYGGGNGYDNRGGGNYGGGNYGGGGGGFGGRGGSNYGDGGRRDDNFGRGGRQNWGGGRGGGRM